ncbi:uncharacterized protein LOC130980832 [Arachis stenosperma]|uniref:uncharacterized protein LOC130980832 n=1 Tax=Arachis stenosperma TaxID=217475 RepID=UPI0025AB8FFE|nr:uncharacterized protein LOC130980832 [Arachis stenosperma]
MTHSQGSTCRQEKELPSKSIAMAHKNTTEIDSRMSQDLKRKETTIEDDIEEFGSLQERPIKKGKTCQFASMPIDTFLKLNNQPDGQEQLDENEGDIIEEQDKDYINPTVAENIDNTLKEIRKGLKIKKPFGNMFKLMVLARINDNWRRYKTIIKQTHFLPYKCVNEMLKNHLKTVPESHFRKLIAYWRIEKVKKMSAQNKKNRAQQKFRHRKGPINFARIRARLAPSKENNEPLTQAEIFVETRQSTKGKSLDEDTLDVNGSIN